MPRLLTLSLALVCWISLRANDAESRSRTEALKLLDEAFELTDKIEAAAKDKQSAVGDMELILAEILSLRALAGDLEAALRTADFIPPGMGRALSLASAAVELSERGDKTSATAAFQRALEGALKADDELRAEIVLEVAGIEVEAGDKASALKACEIGLRLDKRHGRDADFLAGVAAVQANAGDV